MSDALRPLIGIIIIFVVFYLLIFRPQMVKQKQRQKTISEIKIGDRIVTIGGIFGTITKITDDKMVVDVGKGVELTMSRAAIGQKVE